MSKKIEHSNFKTQLEPEKVFKNSLGVYFLVVSIILPLFSLSLYLADYPIWFVYTVLAFLFAIIVLLIIASFIEKVRYNLLSITRLFLFLSIVSFFLCVYFNDFEQFVSFCFLVSYAVIILCIS